MSDAKITVGGRTVHVQEGATLMEGLVAAGLLLRSDCGGRGRCGKCLVQMRGPGREGLSAPDDVEVRSVGNEKLAEGYRLACRARVQGEASIDIPAASRLTREVMRKDLTSQALQVLLPSSVPRPGRLDLWGVAVDLGTTTIAVYLCDLGKNAVAASTSVRNPQSVFGDDVVSRVSAIRTDTDLLPRLQKLAVNAVEWAVSSLCAQVGLDSEHIAEMVCVGNSIMVHIFLGVNPSSIAVYPYTPGFFEARTVGAASIGLRSGGGARLRTLPLISGYLGADIVGASLASDLLHAPPGTMLVDVGTNGEIVLVGNDGLFATSCATGPAFEGASIRHGMQATSGAVDSVRFSAMSDKPAYTSIQRGAGDPKPPEGVCGSGVISAVAELLRAGIIRKGGEFDVGCGFSSLRRDAEGIAEVIIVPEESSGSGTAITLTQADVRAVQLAKGALRAGIDLLCKESGTDRPQKILLAGAFGSCIDRSDALRIGMFPKVDVSDIEVVGNAAGTGAVLALLEEELFDRAKEIARATRVLDLARHSDFQKTFVGSLSF